MKLNTFIKAIDIANKCNMKLQYKKKCSFAKEFYFSAPGCAHPLDLVVQTNPNLEVVHAKFSYGIFEHLAYENSDIRLHFNPFCHVYKEKTQYK